MWFPFFVFGGYGDGVASTRSAGIPHLFPFRAKGVGSADNREVCSSGSQAVSPYGARQKPALTDDTALVSFAHVSSSRQSSCKHGSALDLRNGGLSPTSLHLTSSTQLHFGKASELALHSASVVPGKESKLSLRSTSGTPVEK